jgi:hypothetical protein
MKLKKYKEYPSSREEAVARVKELKAYLSSKLKGPFRVEISCNSKRTRYYYYISCGSVRLAWNEDGYYVQIGSVKNNPGSSTKWKSFKHSDPILAIAGAMRLVRSYMKGIRIAIRDNQMKLQPKTQK